jgi:hypothetical protein
MYMSSSNQQPSLPALAKAGSEMAQRHFNYHRLAHLVALVLASIMAIINHHDLVLYSLAAVAVLAELSAWWWRYQEEHYHHLSRELTRRALLQDAFGPTVDQGEIVHLLHSMDSHQLIPQAIALDQIYKDGGFFTSQLPQGTARCLDNLQESAFWSSYLYTKAAKRTFWFIGIVLALTLILVFAILPIVAQGHIAVIPKLFSILFIFWLADELTTGLAWWEAAASATKVDHRVEDLLKAQEISQSESLAVFSDYAVATAAAPPIPSRLYKTHRNLLNRLWEQRKAYRKPNTAT